MDLPTSPESHSGTAWKRNLIWLTAGLVSTGILSLTASFAPTVFKRLIIFHMVFGIACGMILVWLTTELSPGWRRSLPGWGAGICLLGGINLGWISFQHFQKARADYAAAHPRDAALQSMLENLSRTDPELKARYEEENRRVHPHFQDFLAHRISPLGDWKTPGPELFWGMELLLAAGCCAGTISLKSATRQPQTESSEHHPSCTKA